MQYEKYAKARDARGLTDYAVSKGTGVSATCLSAWKRGEYTPKADKIIKIAEFLGVPALELLQ